MTSSTNPYSSPKATAPPDHLLPSGKTLWLKFNQSLPPLCALCGEPAAGSKCLLIFGFWGELMHIFMSADRIPNGVTIELPFCHEHRHFRQWWPNSAMLILLIPMFAIPAMLLVVRQNWPVFIAASAVVLCTALYFALGVIRRALRVYGRDVNRAGVVLAGLSPRFVAAVEGLQTAESHQVATNLIAHLQQPD